MMRPGRYRLLMVSVLTGINICGSFAQLVHNSTNMYVGQTVEMHVDGALSNKGFVQNQGDLLVTGDWINTQVYQGLGRLTLNGSATQRLNNNSNSVYALRINGSGPVLLEDNLVVDNQLEFLAGIVRVYGANSLTTASGATVNGGSANSFVEGPLAARGTGYKYMPVGKNGRYYPLELLDVSGIDPVVQVEAFVNDASFRLEGYGRIVSLVHWKQSIVSGTYLGSPIAVGYDLPDDIDDSDLDLFQSVDADAPFSPLGSTTTEQASAFDKVTTTNAVKESLVLIGSRVNVAPGEASFYFPTSFSPNAANPDNRSIRVFGEQLEEEDFSFVVYNRWGQLVFESHSLDDMSTKGWSGQQHAGGTLASGAYPYLMKGRRKTGEILEQKGLISITR